MNIYLEMLWSAIQLLWPEAQRRKREFRCIPTHDVDNPFASYQPKKTIYRQILSEWKSARFRSAYSILFWNLLPKYYADPYDTYGWLMDSAESFGRSAEFYFITRSHRSHIEYSLKDAKVQGVISDIAKRGHVIGLHGSYDSFRNAGLLAEEVSTLRFACVQLNHEVPCIGGRQHYLRFSPAETWADQVKAGLQYDSSVYFAESPSYRAGCCYEYSTFDVYGRRKLPLRERPISIMEASFLVPRYKRGGLPGLLKASEKVIKTIRAFNGDFVLLWHNCRLIGGANRAAYRQLLKMANNSP